MRKHWVLAAATMLVLAGCSDDAEPADVPPPPVVSSATSSPEPVASEAAGTTAAAPEPTRTSKKPSAEKTGTGLAGFVSVVRARLPDVAIDRRDEEIEAVAEQACASLAAGKRADAVVAETRSLGTADAEATDQATARELIKFSIDTVCPTQAKRVDEF
jgi:multidrug efflux pump subunit AcrA (membrane-fusion protein)